MYDVAVIGDGVIGLSTAYELARMGGAHVGLYGTKHAGAASEASAGLLAPSMGMIPDAMRGFFDLSLDAYPPFVDRLRAFDPGLRIIQGLIEVHGDDDPPPLIAGARRVPDGELATIEPSLVAPFGATLHTRDGATDNTRLVRALVAAVAAMPTVERIAEDVVRVERDGKDITLVGRSGKRTTATRVVVAAGAWAAALEGLPRRLPVHPLKGQMLALGGTPLKHPIVGDEVYLVPRETETVVGATTEDAGFDLTVDPAAIESLRRAAISLCPVLSDAPVLRTWAGIRPATPDMFPILGPDPADSRVVYACGHSKNGILLAAVTAITMSSIGLGYPTPPELAPFTIARF